MKWVGHVVCRGERRGACWILVGKPEEKRPVERSRHGWQYTVETRLSELRFIEAFFFFSREIILKNLGLFLQIALRFV
jgi:hypothetical protein